MPLIDPFLRDIWRIFFFYELWIFYSLGNLIETHLKPMTSEKIDLAKGVVGKTNCHEKQFNELTLDEWISLRNSTIPHPPERD